MTRSFGYQILRPIFMKPGPRFWDLQAASVNSERPRFCANSDGESKVLLNSIAPGCGCSLILNSSDRQRVGSGTRIPNGVLAENLKQKKRFSAIARCLILNQETKES
jgi:hypothetical protein